MITLSIAYHVDGQTHMIELQTMAVPRVNELVKLSAIHGHRLGLTNVLEHQYLARVSDVVHSLSDGYVRIVLSDKLRAE